jgi:predicted O-methyltransferase YrrM
MGKTTLKHTCQDAENFERAILDPIIPIIAPYSEMSLNEKYFLNGMIRQIKPKKILEVGVSAGGSSAIILNAIKDMPETKVYSVDYFSFYYKNPKQRCGFVVDFFPQLTDKWNLLTGNDISYFIEDIGAEIDFVLLDTAHIHPWETLNFLTILPFLSKKKGGVDCTS